jgi:C_GCAxxG_C_C family probable redox protein
MPVPLEEIAQGDQRILRSLEPFAGCQSNCCQAVLMAFIDQYPEETINVIMDLSQDLGGGIAGLGYICGGLLGAVMVLSRGLKERGFTDEQRETEIDKFIRDFTARYGSPFCSGINGRDAHTEKAYEACRFLVADSIRSVDKVFAGIDQKYTIEKEH